MTSLTNNTFNYQTSFILDKEHFNECYQQSMTANSAKAKPLKNIKAMVLIIIGILLLLLSENAYIAWFLIALAGLEVLSNHYQQAWWVMRQMLGRTSNSSVTLTINTQGITTSSHYGESNLSWSDITKITATEQGYVLYTNKGKNYLSKKHLSPAAQDYIEENMQSINNKT
jgi:hypothetical protein